MHGLRTRSKVEVLDFKPPKKNLTLFEYPQDRCNDRPRSEITFTKYDEDQLKAPKFLNDTIISFFMQYHWDNQVLDDELKSKIHVFNSFFFAKIKSIRSNGDVSYKCLSRWLKDVRIFDKDFLIMPVCDRDHWILVIVCYPENYPSMSPQTVPDEELKEPAVLILNSFYGHAPSVKRTLNQFLRYQWHVERDNIRNFPIEEAKKRGLRLIFPRLPQQKNSYNCGVFLLNFFYCFLKNPRENYIKMFRKEDMSNWFSENKVDIKMERKRMSGIISEQTRIWNNSSSKIKRSQRNREVNTVSPSGSETSLIELVDSEETNSNGSIIVIH